MMSVKVTTYSFFQAVINKAYLIISILGINLPSRETKRFEALKRSNTLYKEVDYYIKDRDYEHAIPAVYELIQAMKQCGIDQYRLQKYNQLIELLKEAVTLQKESN